MVPLQFLVYSNNSCKAKTKQYKKNECVKPMRDANGRNKECILVKIYVGFVVVFFLFVNVVFFFSFSLVLLNAINHQERPAWRQLHLFFFLFFFCFLLT